MNFSGIVGMFSRLLNWRKPAPPRPAVRPGTAPKTGEKAGREAAKRSRKAARVTQRRG